MTTADNHIPYMHIEKYGTDEVEGIELALGKCFIFPKLDGTNASVWCPASKIKAGSRRREIKLGDDNHGFAAWVYSDDVAAERLRSLVTDHPHLRFFGEWLVPHTLKTYEKSAWWRFYIFDVLDMKTFRYLSYDDYAPMCESYGVDYIPPLCIVDNATEDHFQYELKNNGYLIKDGCGSGEGIVIKNYDFKNKYGRTVFAKMVTNDYKAKHSRRKPTEKKFKERPEAQIVERYLTRDMVAKIYSSIVATEGRWNAKFIPRLLQTVYHDFVTEEIWSAVKKFKNPTINFKTLQACCVQATKRIMPELF